MESKKRYKTKQYDELVEYISSIPGQHFTVNELYMHFAGNDKAIGITTLYRHLQRMLDDGIVSKYAVGTNGAACFEYVGDGAPDENVSAYHCKCKGCGKLIHVHCDMIKDIEHHMSDEHGFKIDPFRTVFYGTCEACLDAQKGN